MADQWRRIMSALGENRHRQQQPASLPVKDADTVAGRFYGRLTKAVSREQSLRGEGFTADELRAAAAHGCEHVQLFHEHNYERGAVGRLVRAEFNESDQFLYVHGQIDMAHALGSKVYALVRAGDLRHLSVGFAHPPVGSCDQDPSRYYNRLVEASFVENPHQPFAEVLECHSKDAASEAFTFLCSTAEIDPQLSPMSSAPAVESPAAAAPAQSPAAAAAAPPQQQQKPSSHDTRKILQDGMGLQPDQVRNIGELQGQLAAIFEQKKQMEQQLAAEQRARQEAERIAKEASEDLSVIGQEYKQQMAPQLAQAMEYLGAEQALAPHKAELESLINTAYGSYKTRGIAAFVTHTIEQLRAAQAEAAQLRQGAQQANGYSEALAEQAAKAAYQQYLGNFAPANSPLGNAASTPASVVTQHAAGAATVPASSVPAAAPRKPADTVVDSFLEAVTRGKRRVFDDGPAAKHAATGTASAPVYRTPRGRPEGLPDGM
jgi:HK97 family phage prohead protease